MFLEITALCGKAALALDLGDGKRWGGGGRDDTHRLDHSIGPFEMGPFTKHCQSDIFVVMMSQPVEIMIKA